MYHVRTANCILTSPIIFMILYSFAVVHVFTSVLLKAYSYTGVASVVIRC